MSDIEAEIEGKTIGENSKITFKLKTLIWIVSGLLFVISTIATIGYFDIKREQESLKKDYEKGKQEYKEELKEILKEELKDLRDKDLQFTEDIGEIKGDIKVILDRTLRTNSGNANIPTVEEGIIPITIPIPNR